MTFNQMRYFEMVCRYNNISRAGRELFISQPALSKTIHEIEEECGTALFVRKGNSIYPTDEGLYLLGEIKPILELCGEVNQKIAAHQLTRDYVKLSYSVLSGFESYLKIATEFAKAYPEISIDTSINNTVTNYDLLDSHKVDLIITTKKRVIDDSEWAEQTEYRYMPLELNKNVFCVNAENPLAREEYISWDQLKSCRLVLMDSPFKVGETITEQLKAAGVYQRNRIHYTNQVYVALQLIKKNLSCGFFHESMIKEIPEIVGIPSVIADQTQTYLVWKDDMPLPWTAKAFIDIARAVYR